MIAMSAALVSSPVSAAPIRRSRAVRVVVWTCQILLALAFLAHGLMMLFPPPEVAVQMNATLPRWFSLFIGFAEIAATAGLILPAMTGIQRWLIAAAAGGIMIIMVSATIFHLARHEIGSAVTTFVLLAMATLVARIRSRDYARRPQAPTASR